MQIASVLGADLATTAAARSLFGAGIPVIGWEEDAVDGTQDLGGGEVASLRDESGTESGSSGAMPDPLGIAGGFADSRAAAEIKEADVVLAVGTSLTPFTMRFGEGFAADATIVQVTTDPSQFHPRRMSRWRRTRQTLASCCWIRFARARVRSARVRSTQVRGARAEAGRGRS